MRAPVDIPTDCAGRGTCGKCLVRLGSGELTAPTERELKRIPEKLRAEGWRLACQAYPRSARVSIEVRGTAGQRRILTTSKLHARRRAPGGAHRVRASWSRRRSPTRAPTWSASTRPSAASRCRCNVLECLPARRCATASGRSRRRCTASASIDVHPGDDARRELYGVAVDIGTSKVIAYLFDLQRGALIDQEAIENPQMRYGEDVIIAHRARGPAQRRRPTLAAAVREGINDDLEALYERQGIHANHVCDMTVVGNTAMHHLALGLSPVGLGQAPFAPAAAEPLTLRAE